MDKEAQVQILVVSLAVGIGLGFILTHSAGLGTGISAASFVIGSAFVFVGLFSPIRASGRVCDASRVYYRQLTDSPLILGGLSSPAGRLPPADRC
jgi:hypothetical protein